VHITWQVGCFIFSLTLAGDMVDIADFAIVIGNKGADAGFEALEGWSGATPAGEHIKGIKDAMERESARQKKEDKAALGATVGKDGKDKMERMLEYFFDTGRVVY